MQLLRRVPIFVSTHTFCASRKPWLKRARAGVGVDAINYQNSSISLTNKCQRLLAENLVLSFENYIEIQL